MISVKTGPAFNESRSLAEQLAASVAVDPKTICPQHEIVPDRIRERVTRELDSVIRRQRFYRAHRIPAPRILWWPTETTPCPTSPTK